MDTQKNTVIDGSVKLPIFNIRYLLHKHSVETKLFNNYEFILPEFDEMKEYYREKLEEEYNKKQNEIRNN